MKFSVIFCLLFAISCNSSKLLKDQANITEYSNISPEMNKFLLSFEKAVRSKKVNALLSFIDEEYKVEQLGNLSGNMEQFITELFCGNLKSNNEFRCFQLNEIKNIRLVELTKANTALFQAEYEILTEEDSVIVSWEIHHSEQNTVAGYGFIGAYG